MNYLNIGSISLGARIIQVSSTQDQIIYNASNILNQNKDYIWASSDGLPQYLIIGLDQVTEPYKNITSIGIYSSHDYQTNPKMVQLWVADNYDFDIEEQQFIHWQDISLVKKKGMQVFNIDPIPEEYRFIKLIINSTFGEYQTYLNQVMLLAEPQSLHGSQSIINNQQWQQLRKGFLKVQQKPASSPAYLLKNRGTADYSGLGQQSPIQQINHQQQIRESQKNKFLRKSGYSDYQYHDDKQKILTSHKRNYEHNFHDKKYDKHNPLRQSQFSASRSQYQDNNALVMMSKNMLAIQDNMEDLNRKIQILEIKVDTAYQSFQKNILNQVQQIVERQITKTFSQKNLLAYKQQIPSREHSKSNRMKSSKVHRLGTSRQTKRRSINEKQTLDQCNQHQRRSYNVDDEYKIRNNKHSMNIKTTRKSQKVQNLYKRLQKKLEERQNKMKKLHQKQQKQSRIKNNRYKQATNQYYWR